VEAITNNNNCRFYAFVTDLGGGSEAEPYIGIAKLMAELPDHQFEAELEEPKLNPYPSITEGIPTWEDFSACILNYRKCVVAFCLELKNEWRKRKGGFGCAPYSLMLLRNWLEFPQHDVLVAASLVNCVLLGDFEKIQQTLESAQADRDADRQLSIFLDYCRNTNEDLPPAGFATFLHQKEAHVCSEMNLYDRIDNNEIVEYTTLRSIQESNVSCRNTYICIKKTVIMVCREGY
jgi:hypothetical protein